MNTFSDYGDSVHAPKEKAINKSFFLHVTQIAAGKRENVQEHKPQPLRNI